MEPAYTTAQPENLYPVANGWALDYNPGASQESVVRHAGRRFSRPIQGLGAYPGEPAFHMDRPVHGPRVDQPVHGYRPPYSGEFPRSGSESLRGLGALGAIDLRPYVTFYTSAGAVPVVVDPTALLQGNVIFPIVGSVPYDLDVFGMQMILHVPAYGSVAVPLFGGGTGSSTVTVPGLGEVPYEVSIGPPAAASIPGAVITTTSILGTGVSAILPLVLIGGLAFFLLRR